MEAAQVSINRWEDKQLWDIYTMEFYSAIKKKKILPFAKKVWMDLENIMLSEINQSDDWKSNTIQFHSYVESNEHTELTSKTETDS